MWIHPFSHEIQYYPADLSRIKSLAEKATRRLYSVYGTQYEVGTGADLLSPAAGGSDDWAKESLGIRYVYLVELRPHNDFSNGFILNQDELIPTAIETLEAIKVVVDAILEDNGIAKNSKLFFDDTTSPSPQIEQSALHLVKSQPITNRPPPMNINVSVSNMLDVKVQQNSNNFHQFSNLQNNAFLQARLPPPTTTVQIPTTTTQFLPTIPILDITTQKITKLSTREPSTSKILETTTQTLSTRESSTSRIFETTTESTTITQQITDSITQPLTTQPSTEINTEKTTSDSTSFTHKIIDTIPFETQQIKSSTFTQKFIETQTIEPSSTWTHFTRPTPMSFSHFPVNVAAAISILAHTEQPTIMITEAREESTENLSFTERQQLSEELLRKQLLRIQEINSLRTSTESTTIETTTQQSEPPTTSLIFTSSRRYGPRFLTPPPTMSSRRLTPLSYSQPTTPQPARLPPLVPPRIGASVNIQPHFAIHPTIIIESTTSRTCTDRKFSCVFWITADPYACQDQKSFMEKNCAFSCNLCKTS